MEQALREEGLSGAVWALVEPGRTYVNGAGHSDARSAAPMRPDHRVQVGSVGKVVLAVGILRLVTEGRLSLETPVTELLPELPLTNAWSRTDPVRVKHLLAHTAGLDHSRFWQVFSLEPTPDTPLIESVRGDSALLRVQSRPGSRYAYSNVGYALLGMIVESVTGARYEHYLDEQVLAPLGMNDSTFRFVTQTGPHGDRRLAMGHFEKGAPQAAVPMYLRPAGQFTTTAADMARLARFLMGDGAIDGEPFVAPALTRALGEPLGTEASLAGLSIGHGLALAGRDRHGVYGWCHPGTTIGFVAMFCVYPEHGRAFFVGTNTDSETADYDRLNRLLIASLSMPGRPKKIERASAPPPDVEAWNGFYVQVPRAMSSLAWIDDLFNFVRAEWDGRVLRLSTLQADERVLEPVGAGRLFRAADRDGPSHVLLVGPDGKRVISDGLHSYERTSLARLVFGWTSTAVGLLGLGYVFIVGAVRTLRRQRSRHDPLFIPFIGVLALALPIPLFLGQSFLQLGDRTAASLALATVTAVLPATLVIGMVRQAKALRGSVSGVIDLTMLAAALQWLVVLAAAGLVPFRLWQ
ncbi:MAG TPA: serine hydrolase domain-containing protein [Steroidobacteraceae bacterium]|nr:serine hydrolase domain-containing protein [Steroidobacteraceae bacterium]